MIETTTDIIGDVHGHADKLESLLQTLGYRKDRGGVWRQPDHTVIFVGDLIDRGPRQLRTLSIVRDMVEAGEAEVVMGNHELNAIGWATRDPQADNHYLRPRHGLKGKKNLKQHQAFLSEVGPDSEQHRYWIDWFLALPLWKETADFRVVHACWDPASADALRPHLNADLTLRPKTIEAVYRAKSLVRAAVDVLLKGPEVALPDGVLFTDKDGHVRHEIRTRWWAPHLQTYRDAYIGPEGVDIPNVSMPPSAKIPEPDLPTFIGHYWLEPRAKPEPLASRVVCIDYSAAKGGPLVAYRYRPGVPLSKAGFIHT